MNRIFYFVLVSTLLLLTGCGPAGSDVVATGRVEPLDSSDRLFLQVGNDAVDEPIYASVDVEPDGTFSARADLEQPCEGLLIVAVRGHGPVRSLPLYLEPGKQVEVHVMQQRDDDGNFALSPTFSGALKAECELVNEGTAVDARQFDAFQAFRDSVDRIYAARWERAQSIGNETFLGQYLAASDSAKHHAQLVGYVPHDANLDSVDVAYRDYIDALDFDNPVNEDALYQYLITYGRHYQQSTRGGSATLPALEELTRRCHNQQMLDRISTHLMYFFLMINTPYVETVWAKYLTICKDPNLIDHLRPRYEPRSRELEQSKNTNHEKRH